MKKLIFFSIFTLSVTAYFGLQQKQLVYDVLGIQTLPAPAVEISNPTQKLTLKQLERRRKSIEDLPVEGSHTILFVTAKNCAECDELETDINSILNFRKDVAVKKITLVKSTDANPSMEEIKFQKELLDRFNVTSIPLIKVYDAQRNEVASDKITSEEGEDFIKFWVEAETTKN